MKKIIKINTEEMLDVDGIKDVSQDAVQEKITKPSRRRTAVRKTSKISEERIAKFAMRKEPETKIEKTKKIKKEPRKTNVLKFSLIAILVLVVAALGASSFYFYSKYKNTAVIESDDITVKVGKLIELPNEAVTLATVNDKEKLKDQPFFANAQNGDKALIYTQAKKAILYRPSANKIIEVMYLSIGQNQNTSDSSTQGQSDQQQVQPQEESQAAAEQVQQPADQGGQASSQSQDSQQQASVTVNNGTTQKGLAKTLAAKISQIAGVTIASTGNAKGDFAKTIVVDLSGNNTELATQIAASVEGEVGSLPDGEIKPDADILVIAGGQ